MDYLVDIVIKPKRALKKIAEKPKFLISLIIILVSLLVTFLVCGNSIKGLEAAMPSQLLIQGVYAFANSVVELMIFTLILYGILLIFRKSKDYTLAHYWSLILGSFAIVSIVNLILSVVLIRLAGMVSPDMSLGVIFPVGMDGLPYFLQLVLRFLHGINILHIWIAAILGMAILFFSGVNKKLAFVIAYGLYIVPALFGAFFGQ